MAGFHDQFIARYLDGKEKLIVFTLNGSVRIASFVFTIEGVPR